MGTKGVRFEAVLEGKLVLVPEDERLDQIADDHTAAIEGRIFFGIPDDFDTIISRLREAQDKINAGISRNDPDR